MSTLRSPVRVTRFVVSTLDAIGRARMARDKSHAARAHRLQTACADIVNIHDLQLSVRGRFPTGPAVIVANHVSYLDAIAIAAAVPCAPIAKSEVASWPVIGTAAKQLGVIFVRRDSATSRVRALMKARDALAAGVPVMNFPEGTTTDGSQLREFRRGIFGLARALRVPVIPVAVRCAQALAWYGNAPFVPHYIRATKLAAPAMRLEIGEPIDPTRLATADEVTALAHHRIARMLRDQLEPHAAIIRLRVPAPRPDTVLPPAGRHLAAP
ncbi:MAG TPA: lysophospholipid acyltransferase family protein [Kofleriaceae bacterium]|nr:lysophospholipid acyltransferase family protein [Kofleriaceae bacterium]